MSVDNKKNSRMNQIFARQRIACKKIRDSEERARDLELRIDDCESTQERAARTVLQQDARLKLIEFLVRILFIATFACASTIILIGIVPFLWLVGL
jgi:hypothetical protein